jgi:hypothetical protein
MVEDPPQGMTDIPCKPPYGAALRKEAVLNDKVKGEEYSSGKGQRVEQCELLI